MIAEYLAFLRVNHCASTYNNRVCVLREIFRTLGERAGLADDPWAGVRLRNDDSHSRRELAANAGVPLTLVQSIVGHESTAMTRHYYHESEAALRSAIASIPALVCAD